MTRSPEAFARGLLVAFTLALVATGTVTLGFREPPTWAQLVQVAHVALGLLAIVVGAGYLVVHLGQVFGGWRAALGRAPRAPLAAALALLVVLAVASLDLGVDGRRWLNRAVIVATIGAVVLGVRLAAGAWRRRGRAGGGAGVSGAAALVAAVVVALSGVMVLGGAAAWRVWWVHVTAAALVALPVAGHVRASRRRSVPRGGREYRWRPTLARVALPGLGLLGSLVVLGVVTGLRMAGQPAVLGDVVVPVDRGFEQIAPAGCVHCHTTVSRTWRESSHARAADNPVFRALFRRAYEDGGPAVARTCLTCHAPHARDPDGGATLDEVLASPGFEAGVHCLSCHSSPPGSGFGDGDLHVVPLADQPGARFLTERGDALGGWARSLGNVQSALVGSRMPVHRATFRFAAGEPPACRPCHIQTLTPVTAGRRIDVLQDHYASWARWGLARPVLGCADERCHVRHEEAREGYVVADHGFAAASTYVARVAGGAEAEARVVRFLEGAGEGRSPLLEIDVALTDDDGSGGPALRVATTSRGIGHSFPNGPTDLVQVWLAVRVADATSGRVLVERGTAAPDPELRLGHRLRDAAGELIEDHRLWEVDSVEDRGRIEPGEEHVLRVPLPDAALDVPALDVEAAWRYRRLDPELVRRWTGTEPEGLPIVTVGRVTATLTPGGAP